jgi:hypothetical protein
MTFSGGRTRRTARANVIAGLTDRDDVSDEAGSKMTKQSQPPGRILLAGND